MADIHQALCENEPPALTASSTADEKELNTKWKSSIVEHLKSGLPGTTNAKKLLLKLNKDILYPKWLRLEI